ncbi:MAG TPA: M20 family metallopeptidase [Vicinamibacterales bacterium]|nr:M20 family metallopeptidase [Vicinamibacterales bacterium]
MKLLTFCAAQQGALRRDIEALVRLESPSTDKAAVDRCGAALGRLLEEAGGSVTRLPQADRGDHIRAEFAGGPRRILLLGHFDTVWDVGQIERMPFVEEDGRLYGPGIFDMKSSIAISILAVRALSQLGGGIPRVVMLWTTDEEVGSETSRDAIEAAARASDAVLVLEPSLPGGAAKTRRKGCGEFTMRVHGVSAHAGIDPRKGASAIHELAHQIVALEALRDPERGVSVNVGIIEGGTRGNVVAEDARAVIDVRVPTMEEARRIEGAVRALRAGNPAVRIEIDGGISRPPLERTAGVARLYDVANQVAASLGRDLGEGGTGGGSDGNFTAALGVPTLDGLGPQGDGAHALHEHVIVSDLTWRAAFLATLIHRLNAVT